MSYPVTMLTTVVECDSVLTIAEREKSDLEYRKVTLARQKKEMSETGTEVDQELATVTAEIAVYTTLLATWPDGPSKEEQITKLKRLELRQRTLNKKDQNNGTISLFTLELDIARIQKEMDEIDVFIAAVIAQKATL